MDEVDARMEAAFRRLCIVIVAAALMITLAILLAVNEVRFQGCRDLANDQVLAEVGYQQECSRLPWGA